MQPGHELVYTGARQNVKSKNNELSMPPGRWLNALRRGHRSSSIDVASPADASSSNKAQESAWKNFALSRACLEALVYKHTAGDVALSDVDALD